MFQIIGSKACKTQLKFLTVSDSHLPNYRSQKQASRGVLKKRFLKICSKFTGEHPCRNVISIKMQSNFIEIAHRHGCSPVNLLHIFRTTFLKNSSGWLRRFKVTLKVLSYIIGSHCASVLYDCFLKTLVFPILHLWSDTFYMLIFIDNFIFV